MRLNPFGQIAATCWREIPDHFQRVILDKFIIMPNHVHGILFLVDTASVGTQHAASLHESRPGGVTLNNVKPRSLPAIIRSYKSAVAKSLNAIRCSPGAPVWQGRYYDHIIRSEHSLNLIREYVMYNPARWQEDRFNLGNLPESLDL
jgi:REP element-mobilizing transposase RayT